MSEQTERASIEAADPIPAPDALPAAPAVPVEVPVRLPPEAAGLPSVTVTLTLTPPPPPPPVPESPAAPEPVDEAEKGKAARNERRKARIAFYNGMALAAAGAGLLGPYFTLLQKLPGLFDRLEAGAFRLTEADIAQVSIYGGVAIAGIGFAAMFHWAAMQWASKIED